jgi:hypothetical protein
MNACVVSGSPSARTRDLESLSSHPRPRTTTKRDGGLLMSELIYCDYKGRPTVYVRDSGGIAWWFHDGSWKPAPSTQVFTKAAVIGKREFADRFGKLSGLIPPSTTAGRAAATRHSHEV